MSIDATSVVTVALHDGSERDPRAFITSLASELDAVLPGIGVHYHDPEHGIEVNLDHGGRHQLSYRLRYKGDSLGEVTLRFHNRFSGADINRVESILARALPTLGLLLLHFADAASSDIDSETALQTRTALLRHLARAPVTSTGVQTLLIVRMDDTTDAGTRRRVALQLAAVLRDPDRVYRISDRAFAVALCDAESASAGFLAERIRLMVAAMPVALPAPSVTVAIVEATAGKMPDRVLADAELELDQHIDLRNRVVKL